MWFILASITRQIQSKIAKALPRFAGPCRSFWTQSPVAFRAKIRELCFASLGHVVYFGFNLPSNSEQNFESYGSLRSAMYLFVLICCYIHAFFPSNSEQNFESYASLRSAMYFFVLICCYIHAFFSKKCCWPMKNVFKMSSEWRVIIKQLIKRRPALIFWYIN